MPDTERQKILKILEAQNKVLEELQQSHKELNTKLDTQIEQTKPMIQVYDAVNGSGKVVAWIFRWILLPGATIMGIIFGVHKMKQ